MATRDFEFTEKGLDAVATKFASWYIIGFKEVGSGKYDVVFSEQLGTETEGGWLSNGSYTSGSKEFVMAPGEKVNHIVINSTDITGTGLTGTGDMTPKAGSQVAGDFPYGGLLKITSVTITVATTV